MACYDANLWAGCHQRLPPLIASAQMDDFAQIRGKTFVSTSSFTASSKIPMVRSISRCV
jgi:hypothetical protein